MRRFQDGAVNQSVVWKTPTPVLQNFGLVKINDGNDDLVPSVPIQIVHHLMHRHFGEAYEIDTDGSSFIPIGKTKPEGRISVISAFWGIPNRPVASFLSPSGNAVAHPTVNSAQLKSLLMNLPGLPLDVKDVYFAERFGLLWHADLPFHCPFALKDQPFVYAGNLVLDCVVEFCKSGGWPTTAIAVKVMKAAVLMAIKYVIDVCRDFL